MPILGYIKKLIPRNLRQLLRRSLARVSSVHTPTRYAIMKNSDSAFIRAVIGLLNSEFLAVPSEVERVILARREHLLKSLSGQIVETSYRHEQRKLDAAVVCEGVSSDLTACALVYRVIELSESKRIVELGSAFGLGTIASAMAIIAEPDATLDGIEFESWRAELAQEGIASILSGRGKIHAGRIEDVLPMLVLQRGEHYFDFAFVDAMHTKEATVGYHRLLLDAMRDGGVAVYDDINWSEDMGVAWRQIAGSKNVADAILVADRWGVVRYVKRGC